MSATGCSERRLRRFLDFAAADAGRAGANALVGALDHRMYGLEIQVPAPLRYIVGVADLVTELRSAATYITNSCHKWLL